ncbi:hypothetical protein [Actinokineospora sp. NPDC004072]
MRLRAVLVLPVLTALLGVFTAAPATAAPGDLTCEVQLQTDFVPPITGPVTGSPATISGSLINCVSATGYTMQSGAFSGTAAVTSTIITPCSVVLRVAGTGTIAWTPTATSQFSYVFNTDPTQGGIELSLTITSGVMTGNQMIPVAWFTPNADCALNGLKYLAVGGAGTFE